MPPITISPLMLPTPAFDEVATEARVEGYAFIDCLLAGWGDGSNRFDGPGEYLLDARDGDVLIAVGGLNRDAHVDNLRIGRLRHLYVRPDWRRHGVGALLIHALLKRAGDFDRVRLRTTNPAAARLYERLGFERSAEANATHLWHNSNR